MSRRKIGRRLRSEPALGWGELPEFQTKVCRKDPAQTISEPAMCREYACHQIRYLEDPYARQVDKAARYGKQLSLTKRLPQKAKRVLFLRNMDRFYGGLTFPVLKEHFTYFEKLLEALTEALRKHVQLNSAITQTFRIDGTPIEKLDEFCDGDIVVCCCQHEVFVNVGYRVGKQCMRLRSSLMHHVVAAQHQEALKRCKPTNCNGLEHLMDSDLPLAIRTYLGITRKIFCGPYTVIFESYSRNKSNHFPYIVKVVDRQRICDICKIVYQEVEIMRKLQSHPNIVELIYTVENSERSYIVAERLDCDLGMLINKYGPFSLSLASTIVRKVAKGLAHMHGQQIVHRDIKPANLLVRLSGAKCQLRLEQVKIADFGLATFCKGAKLHLSCGTRYFMAPELLNRLGYGMAVDCWALGVTLYVLLCRQVPFGHGSSNHKQLAVQILQARFSIPQAIKPKLSPASISLINALLLKEPNRRLTAAETCMHPFVLGKEL